MVEPPDQSQSPDDASKSQHPFLSSPSTRSLEREDTPRQLSSPQQLKIKSPELGKQDHEDVTRQQEDVRPEKDWEELAEGYQLELEHHLRELERALHGLDSRAIDLEIMGHSVKAWTGSLIPNLLFSVANIADRFQIQAPPQRLTRYFDELKRHLLQLQRHHSQIGNYFHEMAKYGDHFQRVRPIRRRSVSSKSSDSIHTEFADPLWNPSLEPSLNNATSSRTVSWASFGILWHCVCCF